MSAYIKKILPKHDFHVVDHTNQFVCFICDKCQEEIIWYDALEKIEDAFDRIDIPDVCKPYKREENY